jgi:hypothetical protein
VMIFDPNPASPSSTSAAAPGRNYNVLTAMPDGHGLRIKSQPNYSPILDRVKG